MRSGSGIRALHYEARHQRSHAIVYRYQAFAVLVQGRQSRFHRGPAGGPARYQPVRNLNPKLRAQRLPGGKLVGRQHHDYLGYAQRRLGKAAQRMQQHWLAAQQQELLGPVGGHACAAAARHDDGEAGNR